MLGGFFIFILWSGSSTALGWIAVTMFKIIIALVAHTLFSKIFCFLSSLQDAFKSKNYHGTKHILCVEHIGRPHRAADGVCLNVLTNVQTNRELVNNKYMWHTVTHPEVRRLVAERLEWGMGIACPWVHAPFKFYLCTLFFYKQKEHILVSRADSWRRSTCILSFCNVSLFSGEWEPNLVFLFPSNVYWLRVQVS